VREILIDTSAIVAKINNTADARLTTVLSEGPTCISIITYAELARLSMKKYGQEHWVNVKRKLENVRILDLDTETCEIAALNAQKHNLAIADSLIYASALKNGMTLVTCDADFKGKKDVIYVK